MKSSRPLRDDADLAIKLFGVKAEGNYFEPPNGKTGKEHSSFGNAAGTSCF